MASKIFVSYNFNDRAVVNTVKSMTQNAGGKIDGKFVFVTNDVSDQGGKAIDQEIRSVMSGCDAALFVVGDNSHNSPWINREVELAVSKGLSLVATQLPNTFGGIPNKLKNNNPQIAIWSMSDLAYYLNRIQ